MNAPTTPEALAASHLTFDQRAAQALVMAEATARSSEKIARSSERAFWAAVIVAAIGFGAQVAIAVLA